MNAYELAKYWDNQVSAIAETTATMLRQQADRIAKLEKLKDGCGNCHACLVGVIENHMPVTSQRMILCPDCGNKRCPKASNHRHQCTESNEVGQRGSIYTHPVKQLSDEEIEKIAKNNWVTDKNNMQDWSVIRFARAIIKEITE